MADDPATFERHAREYRTCLRLLLEGRGIQDGNPGRGSISQLDHALQLSTRLERAGVPEELVLIGLLHDVAKPLSETAHPEIAAAMLREYVSEGTYRVLLHHGEVQADLLKGSAECTRYWREPWYGLAVRFSAMDAASFDPEYPSLGLEAFLGPMRRFYRVG